jgi:hypothetical protein
MEREIRSSPPIVFISRNKIKEGRAEEFTKHYQDSATSVMAGKAHTLAQLAYVNENTAEVTILRFFADADALHLQIEGADERSKVAYELIEPTGVEVFGTPNPGTLAMLKRVVGPGVAVSVSPHYVGGFIRPVEVAKGENDGSAV